jgi:hypothetical protein
VTGLFRRGEWLAAAPAWTSDGNVLSGERDRAGVLQIYVSGELAAIDGAGIARPPL